MIEQGHQHYCYHFASLSNFYKSYSLQIIYLKRCKSRAAKIIKNTNQFAAIWQVLQEHDGKNWETEEELLHSGHQAPKLKRGLITFTSLNLINCKIFTILHHLYCCYVYIPCTTCLHIPLAHPCLYYYLLSPQYCTFYFIAHFTLYVFLLFFTYIYIYTRVVLHILHCPLSGPDLAYISLLIIFCIIEYVMNTKTLNPWTAKTLVKQINLSQMNGFQPLTAGICCVILTKVEQSMDYHKIVQISSVGESYSLKSY